MEFLKSLQRQISAIVNMQGAARRNISIAVVLLTMLLGATMSRCEMPQKDLGGMQQLPIEKAVIETQSGKTLGFNLEMAKSPVDIQIGLMYRLKMPEDHGMLFQLGKEPKLTAFWMKNTYIPLDMLFIDENGIIVNIHRNAVPQSLASIPSIKPVTGVIELNGGIVGKLGILIGDKVIHPYFGTAAEKPAPQKETPGK